MCNPPFSPPLAFFVLELPSTRCLYAQRACSKKARRIILSFVFRVLVEDTIALVVVGQGTYLRRIQTLFLMILCLVLGYLGLNMPTWISIGY